MDKKKLILFEKLLYSLTGISGIAKLTNLTMKFRSSIIAKISDETAENTVGFEDVSAFNNSTVHTNNFVIFHVNKDDNIVSLSQKIEFCKKHDISVGIVLDTKADNLATIYEDVDFLQAIVKEYEIDLPVYCNIEYIINSPSLNNAQRSAIMNAFIDKISRSDMYFGFYGIDSDLCDCKEYVLDISPYDCFVVQEDDTIKYDGSCNLRKSVDGEVSSRIDLSKIIIGKNLNDSTELVYSAYYVVQEKDTFHSLSLKFGLSEIDLREYNNNLKGNLECGQIVAIPNLYKSYNQKTETTRYNFAVARGIDISNYQDKINWNRVTETSDFVIVEVAREPGNYTKNVGEYIPESTIQIKNVVENNIQLGLYFCIYKDMGINEYKERLTDYFGKLNEDLNNNNVTLNRADVPVFLDFEVFDQNNDYYQLMSTFENICTANGFTKIGIYGNGNTLKQISSSLIKNGKHVELKDTNWFVWKAGGPQYSSNENYDKGLKVSELVEPKNESNSQYTTAIQQVTNVCKDTGASNCYGNCDVNFCYFPELFDSDLNNNINQNGAITSYIGVDLNDYKGVNINYLLNCIFTSLLAMGVVVIFVKQSGPKLLIKVKKGISECKNNIKVRKKDEQ